MDIDVSIAIFRNQSVLHWCCVVVWLFFTGLDIDISKQWTIGPPVLEIWWSCQISGGPDVANRQICLSNQTQLT